MTTKKVSSTDFQNHAGQYIDEAGKEDILITRYKRPFRVVMDYDEYERLKTYDTRRVYYPHELSDEQKALFNKGFQGRETPEIDHLLD